MAVEARRRCGYRKVGGIYLVAPGGGHPCDRLPLILDICPTCGHGIKQTRGFTWIDVPALTGGVHRNCGDTFPCPLCMAPEEIGRAGLLWIGAQFYPTTGDYIREAEELGISRRITAVPREFRLGKTWILLAHPAGGPCRACQGAGLLPSDDKTPVCPFCIRGRMPAIFRVFQPTAIEQIVTDKQMEGEAGAALREQLQRKGITPVIVPADDQDHQGTVYDRDEQNGAEGVTE